MRPWPCSTEHVGVIEEYWRPVTAHYYPRVEVCEDPNTDLQQMSRGIDLDNLEYMNAEEEETLETLQGMVLSTIRASAGGKIELDNASSVYDDKPASLHVDVDELKADNGDEAVVRFRKVSVRKREDEDKHEKTV